jgi:predicted regulator of Ras-like GTPase activity (Roadblock/LC7/MglB family)
MKHVLNPLAQVPGLRQALVIGRDGLLVHSLVGSAARHDYLQQEAACALVLGWVRDLEGSFGRLSWDAPRRLVVRGSQATLVVCRGPQACLAVWLEPGALPEDLRVPMEAALGRIARLLRGLGQGHSIPVAELDVSSKPSAEPAGALPSEVPTEQNSQEHNSARPITGLTGTYHKKEKG